MRSLGGKTTERRQTLTSRAGQAAAVVVVRGPRVEFREDVPTRSRRL
jgi:hypothetical protein